MEVGASHAHPLAIEVPLQHQQGDAYHSAPAAAAVSVSWDSGCWRYSVSSVPQAAKQQPLGAVSLVWAAGLASLPKHLRVQRQYKHE